MRECHDAAAMPDAVMSIGIIPETDIEEDASMEDSAGADPRDDFGVIS